jgi:hypothetical protein
MMRAGEDAAQPARPSSHVVDVYPLRPPRNSGSRSRSGGGAGALAAAPGAGRVTDAAAASAASVELCVVDGDGGGAQAGGSEGADVCRVCMGGAEEETGDGPLVELSCNCRGGMRLAHAACAEKWFLSRGA